MNRAIGRSEVSMDPKAMMSWAQGGAQGGDESGDADHAAEETAETEAKDWGPLTAALEKHAEEIEGASEELDGDALSDPEAELEPEEASILASGLDDMPPDLTAALDAAKSIGWEQAMSLADHLEAEGLIADRDRVAGWLFRVGQHLAGGDDAAKDPDDEDAADDAGDESMDDPDGEG